MLCFNLFSVALFIYLLLIYLLTELAEIKDNTNVFPVEGAEAFDDDGISDELLLIAVQQYENQQFSEAVLNGDGQLIEKNEG
jgi:hypothetical protein